MNEIIELLFELNKKYEENDYNGKLEGSINYKIVEGKIPILLSCPHAVKTTRENLIKKADALTGAITEYLCRKTNCFGIIRTCNLLDDPNYDNYGYSLLYKEEILNLIRNHDIKFVIDIHGCSNYHNFDIDIGINNGLNINDKDELVMLYEILSRIGKVTIDNKFRASNDNNISNYIHHKSGISCFQLEINKKLRFEKTGQLLRCLELIIDELSKMNIKHKVK